MPGKGMEGYDDGNKFDRRSCEEGINVQARAIAIVDCTARIMSTIANRTSNPYKQLKYSQ